MVAKVPVGRQSPAALPPRTAMDALGWLPTRYITLRGWGLLAAGTLALLLAQVLGAGTC